MALILHLRRRIKSNTNPFLTHLFSTSNSDDGEPEGNSKSPFSSYFSDVKERLKQQQPTRKPPAFSFRATASASDSKPSKIDSLQEIQKNLSEFRRRTSAPAPGEPISFQEIYRRNVSEESADDRRQFSWGPIRDSLRQLRSSGGGSAQSQGDRKATDPLSLPAFRSTLKLNPSDSGSRGSVSGGLPASVFGKEIRERERKRERLDSWAAKTEFVKMYGYVELGQKLKALRPQGQGREGFSVAELNERLIRLREMEEQEASSSISGVFYKDVREGLLHLQAADDEKAKKTALRRLDILGHFGATQASMPGPPIEHLVERYFHPENMSSAEKLKIELKRVRDEFKMSESDCGSARVQVAQLTTKIKHLSSVLHKKDKHSRKGLLAMVQRRKRLLKYLRSTDWDSYCFVISKLGLRDNPDIKY